MIKYENGYAIIDGYKFKKDKDTGYYLSGSIKGKRYRLHRYVYEKHYGEIPKGYEIHHKDQNKDNNEIDNLELLTSTEHKKKHGHDISDEMREFFRQNLNEKARPKAIEWHKSEEGREWHRQQYKISLGKVKHIAKTRILECLNCGKEYETTTFGTTKFCSNNCKSAYRRKQGIDNTEHICSPCGDKFIANKYSKRKYCDKCWRIKK